ncbi:MAG: hypothetical protein EXR79_16685 [Myxococcales bacterium]|nr:hypothetical protein [Myxococcales bacterium]
MACSGPALAPGTRWLAGLWVAVAACGGAVPNPPGADAAAVDAVGATQHDGVAPLDASAADAAAVAPSDAKGPGGAAVQCLGPKEDGDCDEVATCGSAQYCDPCTKKCIQERQACEPCTDDVQCAKALVGGKPGSACLAYKTGGSYCGLVCVGDAGCPKAMQCVAVGGVAEKQCVPKSGSCGAAAGACQADHDCPFQFVCAPQWGACVRGCTADAMCALGLVCSLGHCVAPCQADGACAALADGAKCIDKHCKFPGGCLNSSECAEAETHCDLKTHKCVPGCAEDGDCHDANLKCEAAKCLKKGCKENWECAYAQVCEPANGTCQPMTGPHCAVCDPQDKDAKECGGKPSACFKMQDAEGKDKGAFCGLACGDAPSGPCPQGWACKELKDDKGASQGKFCLRPCYSKPVGT